MKILKLVAIPALALTASAFSFAPAASAAKAPAVCTHNCGATIKITGAYITTAPGYYPTPAGPVITAKATAKFSKTTGTDVTDFRLLVDGKLVPENDTAFGSGSAGVVYGTYTTGMSTDNDNGSISGTGFPVKAGKHVLTYEILGVKGTVLATSATYTVTVPKQAAAVKPKLTYSISNPNVDSQATPPDYFGSSISVHSTTAAVLDAAPNVLTFTLPAGATLLDNQWGQDVQSGTTVTITPFSNWPGGGIILSPSQPAQFYIDYSSPVAFTTGGSVTLDGIPVAPAS